MAMKKISLGILNRNEKFVGSTSVSIDTNKVKLVDIEKSLKPKIPVKDKNISEYRFTTDVTGQEFKKTKWRKWSKNAEFSNDLSKGGYLQIKLED